MEYGLPPVRAPNAQAHAAKSLYQMEAKMTLNQLLFEAEVKNNPTRTKHTTGDARNGFRHGGQPTAARLNVTEMHVASHHAVEAQRLASELLHRLFGTDEPEPERLPRLALRNEDVSRPTLAAAKRFALGPPPPKRQVTKPLAHTSPSPSPTRKRVQPVKLSPTKKRSGGRTLLHSVARGKQASLWQQQQQQQDEDDEPVQHEQMQQPELTPRRQLHETESVERSILVTLWEMERLKLIHRIERALAAYFSWLIEDLDTEYLDLRAEIALEEEKAVSQIWNRFEIKRKFFFQCSRDAIFRAEQDARVQIEYEQRRKSEALPMAAGHERYLIHEEIARQRRDISNEEWSRRVMIETRFKMREYALNEYFLRNWIAALEDEEFAQKISEPWKTFRSVARQLKQLVEVEHSSRALVVAEYESEVPYFDRYQTQLVALEAETGFWSAKRDLEYHENIRRLFMVAHEEQERQERMQNFLQFMQTKNALLSGSAVQALTDNEAMRRGFLVAGERSARGKLQLGWSVVLGDYMDQISLLRREAASVAIRVHKDEPRYQRSVDLEDHEAIRRVFVMQEELGCRGKLLSAVRIIMEDTMYGEDDGVRFPVVSPRTASAIGTSEEIRRGHLESVEGRERRTLRTILRSEGAALLLQLIASCEHNESVRRSLIRQMEARALLIVTELVEDNEDASPVHSTGTPSKAVVEAPPSALVVPLLDTKSAESDSTAPSRSAEGATPELRIVSDATHIDFARTEDLLLEAEVLRRLQHREEEYVDRGSIATRFRSEIRALEVDVDVSVEFPTDGRPPNEMSAVGPGTVVAGEGHNGAYDADVDFQDDDGHSSPPTGGVGTFSQEESGMQRRLTGDDADTTLDMTQLAAAVAMAAAQAAMENDDD